MPVAYFRFYEELNDFLPKERKKNRFPWSFSGNPSVKHAIEALGVPHTEVDLILANGQSVDFSFPVHPDDDFAVYPVFESMDISCVTHLREQPLRDPKFVADAHLGKLAKYLRLYGFDTLYRNDIGDGEIISLAETGRRIVLTRDRDLLKNKRVTRGYYVHAQQPDNQLLEVLTRLDLRNAARPFTRCIVCNGLVQAVDKKSIEKILLPKTQLYYHEFWQCDSCKRIYWKGSHWERMRRSLGD
jgi:uncharacterized protein with PIN domain